MQGCLDGLRRGVSQGNTDAHTAAGAGCYGLRRVVLDGHHLQPAWHVTAERQVARTVVDLFPSGLGAFEGFPQMVHRTAYG